MPSRPMQQPGAGDLLAIAEALERDCSALAQSLAATERARPDQLEDCCRRHLEAVRSVCPRISAAAAALREQGDGPSHLPSGVRDELAARLERSRSALQQVAAAYSRLGREVSARLGETGGKLLDIRRAGQVLHAYAEAARAPR